MMSLINGAEAFSTPLAKTFGVAWNAMGLYSQLESRSHNMLDTRSFG